MTYKAPKWELGYSGNDAALHGHSESDPLGQRRLAYAERLPGGGWQVTAGDGTWYPTRNLVDAQNLIEATLILTGVIEP